MKNLWRVFKYSWQNLFRNAWLGLATIFVFVMALLSVNVLLGVNVLMTRVITALEEKIDVTVTFLPATPEAIVTQAKFYLTSLSQVATVKVVTPAEALVAFRERHAKDPKILSALDELKANPLGAQLVVKAKEADDYPFLLQAIQNPQYTSYIQSRTYDDHQIAIERVRVIGRNGRIAGAVLVAIFALFGLLTAFNAIRVAIYTQREEIGIMRLVGASSFFIRGPFLLEGIWLATFSLLISVALLVGAMVWLEPALKPLFEGLDPGLFTYFRSQGPFILGVEALGMFLIVGFVSWVAAGRYIKR